MLFCGAHFNYSTASDAPCVVYERQYPHCTALLRVFSRKRNTRFAEWNVKPTCDGSAAPANLLRSIYCTAYSTVLCVPHSESQSKGSCFQVASCEEVKTTVQYFTVRASAAVRSVYCVGRTGGATPNGSRRVDSNSSNGSSAHDTRRYRRRQRGS